MTPLEKTLLGKEKIDEQEKPSNKCSHCGKQSCSNLYGLCQDCTFELEDRVKKNMFELEDRIRRNTIDIINRYKL
jgi:ribosomal protein L37E